VIISHHFSHFLNNLVSSWSCYTDRSFIVCKVFSPTLKLLYPDKAHVLFTLFTHCSCSVNLLKH
jgi:hypothetical protein